MLPRPRCGNVGTPHRKDDHLGSNLRADVVGLRGFNIIADRYLEDPKAYADILNRFFSPMTKIVQDRNGMVDRTVGDTSWRA